MYARQGYVRVSCDFTHRKQSNARDIDLNGIFNIMPLYRDEYLYGEYETHDRKERESSSSK